MIQSVIFIVASALLLYSSYITNGFVWLDHGDIELGRTIVPLSEWYRAFVTPLGSTGFYRPLVTLSNSLDFAIYGLHPWGYHVTNVIFHIFVILMIGPFLRILFKLSKKEQLASAAIFAVTPIHWLLIGAISYRQEIMFTLFTMLTVYFYAKKSIVNYLKYIFVSCFTFFAFLSKETALFAIPVTIGLYEWSGVIKNKQTNKKSYLWIAIGAMYVVYSVMRWHALNTIWLSSYPQLDLSNGLGTRLFIGGVSIARLFSPFLPKLSDSVRVVPVTHIYSLVTLGILVCILIGMKRWGRVSLFWNAVTYTIITILPAFQIIPTPRFYSSHYAYFSSLFLPVLVIAILRKLYKVSYIDTISIRFFSWKTACLFLLAGWFGVASFTTYYGGYLFQNDISLFDGEVVTDDSYREGHQYLGDVYYFHRAGIGLKNSDRLKNAEMHYIDALSNNKNILSYVDRGSVLNNLAGIYVEKEQFDKADTILSQLQSEHGSYDTPLIRYNRAVIAYRQKKYDKVVRLLQPTIHMWKRTEPLYILADSLMRLKREQEAEVVKKILIHLK